MGDINVSDVLTRLTVCNIVLRIATEYFVWEDVVTMVLKEVMTKNQKIKKSENMPI